MRFELCEFYQGSDCAGRDVAGVKHSVRGSDCLVRAA